MKTLLSLLLVLHFTLLNEPKLLVKTETIQFTVKKGIKKKINVPIQNTGDAPLIIYAVEPTCGCTVSEFPKVPIKAGENGNIFLEFDSAKKPVGTGSVNIIIKSNTRYKYARIVLVASVI
ncbi:DUF1573 domain-containing protein [Hufsiella ginkgonis]|uniref:DUF1573 domain-containing protein n=1 Tax=Hufsiella ginkgonis TaxID=2695274 RepID=A0A7K1XT96_9SPHI|nr:DUF1573 domain-containing protein [Hufsiella ginkgonis]MXV14068.1 DUF1573 domain-containing protein [Hufsiella ginkgonis]